MNDCRQTRAGGRFAAVVIGLLSTLSAFAAEPAEVVLQEQEPLPPMRRTSITSIEGRTARIAAGRLQGVKAGAELPVLDAQGQPVGTLRVTVVAEREAEGELRIEEGHIVRVGDEVDLSGVETPPGAAKEELLVAPGGSELDRLRKRYRRQLFPRLDLESANPLAQGFNINFGIRRAEFKGRRMRQTERGVRIAVLSRLDLSYTSRSIAIFGRNRPNRFDSKAQHWQLKYTFLPARKGVPALAGFFEWVHMSDGKVVTADTIGTFKNPSGFTLGVLASQPISERLDLHYGFSFARASLSGLPSVTVVGFPVGSDYAITSRFSTQFNTSLFFNNFRGARTVFVFSGTLAYRVLPPLQVEFNGGFAPSGLPFAGTPLTGATAFVVHFPGGGLVREFSRGSVGFYTLRINYTQTF